MYGYKEDLVYSFEEFLNIAPSLKQESEESKKMPEEEKQSIVHANELLDELDDEVVEEYDTSNVKTR